MKSQVPHTMWCNITGEAAGEVWHWSLSGVKGLSVWSHTVQPDFPVKSVMMDRPSQDRLEERNAIQKNNKGEKNSCPEQLVCRYLGCTDQAVKDLWSCCFMAEDTQGCHGQCLRWVQVHLFPVEMWYKSLSKPSHSNITSECCQSSWSHAIDCTLLTMWKTLSNIQMGHKF